MPLQNKWRSIYRCWFNEIFLTIVSKRLSGVPHLVSEFAEFIIIIVQANALAYYRYAYPLGPLLVNWEFTLLFTFCSTAKNELENLYVETTDNIIKQDK